MNHPTATNDHWRALSTAELRAELIARADAIGHQLGGDEDNTRWLACVIAVYGWPDRRVVRADGAAAALLLAGRAPIEYRASWRAKLLKLINAGTVNVAAARTLVDTVTSTVEWSHDRR